MAGCDLPGAGPRSLGWCAATLTSIALASVAMLPVLRTATPGDGGLVSADQLRDSPEGDPSRCRRCPPPRPRRRPAPPRPRSARRRAHAVAHPLDGPRDRRPPATEPETTVEDGWTVTTDGDGAKTYVRSFRVEGGQAVIRMTEGRVQLVTATPSDGYAVATVQNSPDNLAVYFNEANHSFIIHAVWNVDRPFAQVSEIGS